MLTDVADIMGLLFTLTLLAALTDTLYAEVLGCPLS